MSLHTDAKPWTVPALAEAKREGRRLAMLTAYDAGFARVLDASGIDLVLIGDSLGMVVQGHDSTLPVTVEDIEYHTAAVARAEAGLAGGRPAVPGRCHAGARAGCIHAVPARRCGNGQDRGAGTSSTPSATSWSANSGVFASGPHPQSVLRLGATSCRGASRPPRASWWPMRWPWSRPGAAACARMRAHAFGGGDHRGRAGADHRHRRRPVRRAGAGVARFPRLDSGHRRPKFVKDFLAEGGSVAGAVRAYVDAVHGGTFPDAEHSYA
jgi:3-methyl-2-oxobutanoate hydroxymethyltransferase